jgi:hypothetical protein
MQFRNVLCATILTLVSTSAAFAGVTVSSPAAGSTVATPAHFVASASSNFPITGMRVYVDNVSVFATGAATIDTSIAMNVGSRYVVTQAWDSTGAVFTTAMTLNVTTGTGTPSPTPTPAPTATPTPVPGLPAPPVNALVQSDIDQMTGWQSCTTCAGAGGNGPTANFSMAQNVASPSMDGKAAQFNIAGTTPYSDALWWKQLGANNAVQNFKYEVYFYLTNPNVTQALEFDANQSNGAHKFIFGTQCNVRNGSHWDVWGGTANVWENTGIACTVPAAFTWHHLVWEFQRTATNTIFVGFTYDGVTHYVNKSYPAIASGVNELNVAFQMDGDYAQHAYSTWLDKVSLTSW